MTTNQTLTLHRDICPYTPWTLAMLDNLFRKFLQNPKKILAGYIQPGMKVLDIGCGPGFFTLPMAQMVGPLGMVIAIDVQKEMLDLVIQKSERSGLVDRIWFHQCTPESLDIQEQVDFILSFYMVHEVPDRDAFFSQVRDLLAPGGKYLVVEPIFHVSATAFDDTLAYAINAGLMIESRPQFRLSRAALLTKELL
jgi:ubiquinone/menaquinone biosynthesis C-methylase UbiE